MFLAAIDAIFQKKSEKWDAILAGQTDSSHAISVLIDHESRHQGEFGFYRLVFTGLTETDDPDIRTALVVMYKKFHQMVCRQVTPGEPPDNTGSGLSPDPVTWALLGLATVSNIIRELGLLQPQDREQMFLAVSRSLLDGMIYQG